MDKEKNLIIEIRSKNDKNDKVDLETIKRFIDYKERILLSNEEIDSILIELINEKRLPK